MWKGMRAATLPGFGTSGRHRRIDMMRPMSPQGPDAVLFDNDGLLLDTESVWTRAEQDMFDAYGQEFTPQHKLQLIGKSGAIASELLEGWLGQEGRGVELMTELDQMVVVELEHGVEAMVGARDLLERLQAQGTPIGLVSNSPLSFVERSLEIVGFEGVFDTVVSGHEVAEPKPAPDPYLEACRRLGVGAGPGVIVLEDSPTGVAAARAAGLTVIGVPSVEGVELAEAHHIAATLLDTTVLGLTIF
jgi:HAD superfamily hydrolase (TIGR01509 family)